MKTALRSAAAAVGRHALGVALFVAVTVVVRGRIVADWGVLNPDEAELLAQARAAMHSPLPFTTWTMGTTGPFWPLFLAALGWLGFPLTMAFAHLLAAVLVGVCGYVVYVLLSRTTGRWLGLALAVGWWFPLALAYPVAGRADFGALSTELLPITLVLLAALFSTELTTRRPWVLAVAGLACGVAVGAKYQVLPVVGALVVAQVLSLPLSPRGRVRAALWWLVGAAAPFIVLGGLLLISPRVSFDLARQNIAFLGAYSGSGSPLGALSASAHLVLGKWHVLALMALVAWACFLSRGKVAAFRVLLVGAGLVAVIGGGNAFPHYLWLLYAALALALALPLRDGLRLVAPWPRRDVVVGALAAVAAASLVIAGAVAGVFRIASPANVADDLSSSSVTRVPALSALCPPDSTVLVWGWAAELYVDYSWRNAVPFMNTLGLRSSADLHDSSRPLVADGIDRSTCVIDAVGSPFFGAPADSSIVLTYPETAGVLGSEFRTVDGLFECEACTVYVRN